MEGRDAWEKEEEKKRRTTRRRERDAMPVAIASFFLSLPSFHFFIPSSLFFPLLLLLFQCCLYIERQAKMNAPVRPGKKKPMNATNKFKFLLLTRTRWYDRQQ